jgi:superfamily I DNA/RNA helicase
LKLIENYEWIRTCIRAKYPVVVIDEYQDLGVPLHRMVVWLMMRAGVRIIAVGDPDQSIYGFTGAKPGLLRKLAAAPDVEAVELKLNYRCADQIIAASKTMLSNPADFKSHDGRQGEIRIFRVQQDVRGQANFALGTVVPALLKQNAQWKPGDIAVLYRSLNEGTSVAEAADSLEMRYFRLDNGSPIKRSRLIEWLTDAARWCAGAWHSGEVSLARLLKAWRLMRRSLVREKDALEERTKLISTLFAHRDGSIPLHSWLVALHKAVLDDAFKEEPGLADERDNFEDLLKLSKDGLLQSYSIETFGNQGRSPDQINLMTLHSSKGLEFQAVIIVGLEADAFPSKYDNTQEKLEEARRLFYVGLTRAKNMIHLMYGFQESPFIAQVRQATTA